MPGARSSWLATSLIVAAPLSFTSMLPGTSAVLEPAETPPMGWRSWNCFLVAIDHDVILGQARALAQGPLLNAGYGRIGIDGGWTCQEPATESTCTCGGVNGSYHDAAGDPVVGKIRFPNLTALTQQVHSQGVKLDWYGNSCFCIPEELKQWGPQGGNALHDVAALDSFGMDGIKVDGCGAAHNISQWVVALEALQGPPLLLENCGDNHAKWSPPDVATIEGEGSCGFQMYRISTDIAPQYYSAISNLQDMIPYTKYSRPGCWPYPDMLQVGSAKFSDDEARSHFAAWCISSAPLILGYDLTDADSVARAQAIVGNLRAIAVNQAYYGHGGTVLTQSRETFVAFAEFGAAGTQGRNVTFPAWQVWSKPIDSDGTSFAVLLLNIHPNGTRPISFDLSALGGNFHASDRVILKDVWTGSQVAELHGNDTFTASAVPPHGNVFLTISSEATGLL